MNEKIKILIVDDHAIFRQGLSLILNQSNEFKVVAEAENGKQMLEILNSQMPDIILLDISMPVMDGIEATRAAIKKYPQIRILTVSGNGEEIYYLKMIKAGVKGFVQKEDGKAKIENAIRTIHAGNTYFPKSILKKLAFSTESTNANKNNTDLSDREIEVLRFICNGYSNSEIASELSISPKTVDNHRTKLLHKTGARNSANLVLFAVKNKLI